MNICILNTSDTVGGAAIAAHRLYTALSKNGVDATILVRHHLKAYDSNIAHVKQLPKFIQKEAHPLFVLEKALFVKHEKGSEYRFAFSTNKFGFPVYKHPFVTKADVIHLHWINNAYISLNGLHELFNIGKPVVWTLHDMWAFTGGCHYSGECEAYRTHCRNCPFLKYPSNHDLSSQIFKKKREFYKDVPLHIVTCSKWLEEKVRSSSLLGGFPVHTIPNPIDIDVFKPFDKKISRETFNLPKDKFLLLFAASNILDKRKGLSYLIGALNSLSSVHPELLNKVELLVIGKAKNDIQPLLKFNVNNVGILTSQETIASLFKAVDAFILPSLEDNLPNTIMESLACGTPVIAFETGGIPEMILHGKTGYLAKQASSDSLAEGIRWIIENHNIDFQRNCVNFVSENYSETIIAEKYLKLYQRIFEDGK